MPDPARDVERVALRERERLAVEQQANSSVSWRTGESVVPGVKTE